jgi:hypothetical protein
VLVLETDTDAIPTMGLPDSGRQPTVVAPDFSNVPPGGRVLDPETGEEFIPLSMDDPKDAKDPKPE